MKERSFSIFRRIHVRLTLASQVAYECFSFTAVPQTDLKHFNLESSLGYASLTGQLTQTGLDASPEPESHGCLCPFWSRQPSPTTRPSGRGTGAWTSTTAAWTMLLMRSIAFFWGQVLLLCRRNGEAGSMLLAAAESENGWPGDCCHYHVQYRRLPSMWCSKGWTGQNWRIIPATERLGCQGPGSSGSSMKSNRLHTILQPGLS